MTARICLAMLVSVAGCGGPTRDATIMDPADFPLEFEGSFLAGAAGVASIEIASDGRAVLEFRAYRWAVNGEGILGPEQASIARGVLMLEPEGAQEGVLQYRVLQTEDPVAYPTVGTYMMGVAYRPVSGSISVSPAAELTADVTGPREGTPVDEGYSWVLPPETLNDQIQGPVSVHCAEGLTYAVCEGAAP